MKTKLIYHAGYVKIHYSMFGKRTRINTKVRVHSKASLNEAGVIVESIPDLDIRRTEIELLKMDIDDAIRNYYRQNKAYPHPKDLGDLIKDEPVNSKEELVYWMNKFISFKKEKYESEDRNLDSSKEYENLLSMVEDYQTKYGGIINLSDVNDDWLKKLVAFGREKREDFDKPKRFGGKYHLRGNIKNNTMKKRITSLREIFHWLDTKSVYTYPKSIDLIELKAAIIIRTTLSKEEVKDFYETDLENRELNYVKSIFTFSCYTGLRFSDLIALKDEHFVINKGKTAIIFENKKTGKVCNINVNQVALAIWNKYKKYDDGTDLRFGKFSNASLNKYLKIGLQKSKMFFYNTRYINEETEHPYEKWETVSMHTGRRTFVTLLLGAMTPLNVIMSMTGHTSINTLNKYIDTNIDADSDYTDALIS